jgi:hypothetical protein
MFINIIGFIGDKFKDPKEREKAYRRAIEVNKQEYIKYLKAQAMLDGTYIDS